MTTKTNNNLNTHHNKNLGNLPIWDLSDLYDSIESKKITSDLEFIPKAINAACPAEVPELNVIQYLLPIYCARADSNFSISGPIAQSIPRLKTTDIFLMSFSSVKTLYSGIFHLVVFILLFVKLNFFNMKYTHL